MYTGWRARMCLPGGLGQASRLQEGAPSSASMQGMSESISEVNALILILGYHGIAHFGRHLYKAKETVCGGTCRLSLGSIINVHAA